MVYHPVYRGRRVGHVVYHVVCGVGPPPRGRAWFVVALDGRVGHIVDHPLHPRILCHGRAWFLVALDGCGLGTQLYHCNCVSGFALYVELNDLVHYGILCAVVDHPLPHRILCQTRRLTLSPPPPTASCPLVLKEQWHFSCFVYYPLPHRILYHLGAHVRDCDCVSIFALYARVNDYTRLYIVYTSM